MTSTTPGATFAPSSTTPHAPLMNYRDHVLVRTGLRTREGRAVFWIVGPIVNAYICELGIVESHQIAYFACRQKYKAPRISLQTTAKVNPHGEHAYLVEDVRGSRYIVETYASGVLGCDCSKAFNGGKCWHVKLVRQRIASHRSGGAC